MYAPRNTEIFNSEVLLSCHCNHEQECSWVTVGRYAHNGRSREQALSLGPYGLFLRRTGDNAKGFFLFQAFKMRKSSPSILISVPEYLPKRMRSPSFSARENTWPSSLVLS